MAEVDFGYVEGIYGVNAPKGAVSIGKLGLHTPTHTTHNENTLPLYSTPLIVPAMARRLIPPMLST